MDHKLVHISYVYRHIQTIKKDDDFGPNIQCIGMSTNMYWCKLRHQLTDTCFKLRFLNRSNLSLVMS